MRRVYSHKPTRWAYTCGTVAANTWDMSMPGANCRAKSATMRALSANRTARRARMCPGPHSRTPKRRVASWPDDAPWKSSHGSHGRALVEEFGRGGLLGERV